MVLEDLRSRVGWTKVVSVERHDKSPSRVARSAGRTLIVVERLRTGEKARLRGLEALAGVIARMTERGPDEPRPEEEPGAKPLR